MVRHALRRAGLRPDRQATRNTCRCFGSGTIRKELIKNYGSPFAVETAHIKFKDTDVSARIIRSLFDTARQYRESIDVYGSKASVEWPLVEHEPLVMHTAKLPEPKIPKPVKAPDFAKRLPKAIQRFTTKGVYDLGKKTHLSFTQGAGHGGIASAPGARIRQRARRRPRSVPEREAIRQLDLRRPLRPSSPRCKGGADRETAGVHALNLTQPTQPHQPTMTNVDKSAN